MVYHWAYHINDVAQDYLSDSMQKTRRISKRGSRLAGRERPTVAEQSHDDSCRSLLATVLFGYLWMTGIGFRMGGLWGNPLGQAHCELQEAFIDYIEYKDDKLVTPMPRSEKEFFIRACPGPRLWPTGPSDPTATAAAESVHPILRSGTV
jgi:hypothetical protein